MKIFSSTDAHLSRLSFVLAWVLVKVDPNDSFPATCTTNLVYIYLFERLAFVFFFFFRFLDLICSVQYIFKISDAIWK